MGLDTNETENVWNTIENDRKYFIVPLVGYYHRRICRLELFLVFSTEYLSQFLASSVNKELDVNASVLTFALTASEQLAKLTKGNLIPFMSPPVRIPFIKCNLLFFSFM